MNNIETTIRELEAQRDRLIVAIASLRAVSNGKGHKPTGPVPTITGASLAHLRAVGKPQTSQELRAAIHAAGVVVTNGSIQTVLSDRARAKRDLVKRGRAVWGLKEWGK